MSNQYTFEEVMHLADFEPDKQIWCINMEGTIDFITTAKDIKSTVGNFNWEGVSFMKIGDSKDDQQEQSESKDNECNADTTGEFTFTKKKIKHRIQMFKSNNLADLMTMANQFLENIEDIVRIDYQIGQSNTIGLLSMEYSVMIHYVES